MFKKISLFYLLVCVFICKETYASKTLDKNIKKESSSQKKTEKHKYESRFYFF